MCLLQLLGKPFGTSSLWWMLFAFAAIISVIQIVLGPYFLQESPRWLISKKRNEKGKEVLLWLRTCTKITTVMEFAKKYPQLFFDLKIHEMENAVVNRCEVLPLQPTDEASTDSDKSPSTSVPQDTLEKVAHEVIVGMKPEVLSIITELPQLEQGTIKIDIAADNIPEKAMDVFTKYRQILVKALISFFCFFLL